MKSGIATEKSRIQHEVCFHQRSGIGFKEENITVLLLMYNFLWCLKLDTSESTRRSEIPGNILNVVLMKDGEDQLRTIV